MNSLTLHLKVSDRVSLDRFALKSMRFFLTQGKTLSSSAPQIGTETDKNLLRNHQPVLECKMRDVRHDSACLAGQRDRGIKCGTVPHGAGQLAMS